MSKTPSNQGSDKVSSKYPGLKNKKPVRSISVQRPIETDRKTVTETNLEPITDDVEASVDQKKPRKKPVRSKTKPASTTPQSAAKPAKPAKSAKPAKPAKPDKPADPAPDDDIVLELPPSPEHRKAKRRKALWIWTAVIVTLLTAGWAILF